MTNRLQVEQIIVQMMASWFPSFDYLKEERPGYWFRQHTDGRFFNIILFTSSQKHMCFEVNVYAGLFPTWDKQYGLHQLRVATGLPNLRHGSTAVSMKKTPYYHNGSESGVNRALKKIGNELEKYAISWFRKVEEDAFKDTMVCFGLSWIRERYSEIPSTVVDEVNEAFRIAQHKSYNVQYPLLNELKDALREHGSLMKVTKWQRQEISVLALDLLQYVAYLKGNDNGGSGVLLFE